MWHSPRLLLYMYLIIGSFGSITLYFMYKTERQKCDLSPPTGITSNTPLIQPRLGPGPTATGFSSSSPSPSQICGCPIQIPPNVMTLQSSFCSIETTVAAKSSNVLSYSFYIGESYHLDQERSYLTGIQDNLSAARKYYPGWVMRLYTNVLSQHHQPNNSMSTSTMAKGICALYCAHPTDFQICDTTNLPVLGNISKSNGMLWRFLLFGDPTVNIFLVKDLDSLPSDREIFVVNEWLKSNYTFYTMRDHPGHKTPMMGGLWGAKNYKIPSNIADMFNRMILFDSEHQQYGYDQYVLARNIYPYIRKVHLLVHDSFHCNFFKDSIPFPIQRKGGTDFVLNYYQVPDRYVINEPCPVECRPRLHVNNWTYC